LHWAPITPEAPLGASFAVHPSLPANLQGTTKASAGTLAVTPQLLLQSHPASHTTPCPYATDVRHLYSTTSTASDIHMASF